MIVAGVSSYREGPQLASTLRSAAMLDRICLFEGPAGPPRPDVVDELHEPPIDPIARAAVDELGVDAHEGAWASDAEKRTALLQRVQSYPHAADEPLWLLWLDGDELLLWGEYLVDHATRAAADENAVGGFALRIVELDGSCLNCYGKLVRADLVKRYLESSYQVELPSGMVVALPNVPLCGPGGVPAFSDDDYRLSRDEQVKLLAKKRPPLQGEPHLLHRTALRDPARGVERLHEREPEWYEQADPELYAAIEQPYPASPLASRKA